MKVRTSHHAVSLLVMAAWTPVAPVLGEQGFVVNHRHVVLFERIPPGHLEGARNLGMLFSDRSVGLNTDAALNCLTASSWAAMATR